MFHKDSLNIYRVRPLEQFEWLVHGFGTRSSNTFHESPNLVTLRQVHSDTVVDATGRTGCLGEGDAMVADSPGILLAVKTADCLPILFVDEKHRAIAATHAGWRGTMRKIAQNTAQIMHDRFGTESEDLHVAIGPGIGGCCFEVGPEVAVLFDPSATGKIRIDLSAVNLRQLREFGIPERRIYISGLCTVCGGEEFCSYRREKDKAGRMFSAVGLR